MSDSNLKQRQTILEYLQKGNKLTTLYAREVMGIMHPAARVQELKQQGYKIVTHKKSGDDVTGSSHRVAEYVLMTGQPQPANPNQSDFFSGEAA